MCTETGSRSHNHSKNQGKECTQEPVYRRKALMEPGQEGCMCFGKPNSDAGSILGLISWGLLTNVIHALL